MCQRVAGAPRSAWLTLLCAASFTIGCARAPQSKPSAEANSTAAQQVPHNSDIANEIHNFCGDCHVVPRPESFPRRAWYREVERGYNFYYESNRTDLHVPVRADVVAYFQERAPDELDLPHPPPLDTRLTFSKTDISVASVPLNSPAGRSPAVAHLNWNNNVGIGQAAKVEGLEGLLVSDMRVGQFYNLAVDAKRNAVVTAKAFVANASHAEPTDLDNDGRQDFLVADLGSFSPEDHSRGAVIWVRQHDNGQFVGEPLINNLGRVSDVQVTDFNGDQLLDLVVAEFGWLKTGRILTFLNNGNVSAAGVPQFDEQVVDKRHGVIHVPVADLNSDGRSDFVALISQEFETIVGFINRGDGTFEPQTILPPRDPSFGSSGIQLVDLDQDGDLDVLYTNGDLLDSLHVKPYHGIHWIENLRDGDWHPRELLAMPGVMRAIAGDLDGDTDLDIVACAFIPPQSLVEDQQKERMATVAWLEQTAAGTFQPHALELGAPIHAALELGDFDRDGKLDIAVGNFQEDQDTALTLWWNDTRERQTSYQE